MGKHLDLATALNDSTRYDYSWRGPFRLGVGRYPASVGLIDFMACVSALERSRLPHQLDWHLAPESAKWLGSPVRTVSQPRLWTPRRLHQQGGQIVVTFLADPFEAL